MSKREAATKILLDRLTLIDKHTDVDNVGRYRTALGDMSDAQFDRYMKQIRDGKACVYIMIPNMEKHPNMSDMVKLCAQLGVELSSRLNMYDDVTGEYYLTPEKYLTIRAPARMQEQFGDHKRSIPRGDHKVDAMTGQVIGDSRAAGITNPENQALKTKGLNVVAKELVAIRGGNIDAYQTGIRKQGEETGHIRMEDMPADSANRTVVVAQILMEGMHLANNIAEG